MGRAIIPEVGNPSALAARWAKEAKKVRSSREVVWDRKWSVATWSPALSGSGVCFSKTLDGGRIGAFGATVRARDVAGDFGARFVVSPKIGAEDVDGTGDVAVVDCDRVVVCAARASARETEKLIRATWFEIESEF